MQQYSWQAMVLSDVDVVWLQVRRCCLLLITLLLRPHFSHTAHDEF